MQETEHRQQLHENCAQSDIRRVQIRVISIDDCIISSSHLDWFYCTVLQFKSVNVSHIACHTFPPLSFFFLSFLQPSCDIDPRENSRLSTYVGYEGNGKIITRFVQRVTSFLNKPRRITIPFYFNWWIERKKERKNKKQNFLLPLVSKFSSSYSLFFFTESFRITWHNLT